MNSSNDTSSSMHCQPKVVRSSSTAAEKGAILRAVVEPNPHEASDHDDGLPKPHVLSAVLADLENYTALYGADSDKVAETWNTLGLIRLHMQRNVPAAIKCHTQALRIYRQVYSSCSDNKKNTPSERDTEEINDRANEESSTSSSSSSNKSSSSSSPLFGLPLVVTLFDLGCCYERRDRDGAERALELYHEARRLIDDRVVSVTHTHTVAKSVERCIARIERR